MVPFLRHSCYLRANLCQVEKDLPSGERRQKSEVRRKARWLELFRIQAQPPQTAARFILSSDFWLLTSSFGCGLGARSVIRGLIFPSAGSQKPSTSLRRPPGNAISCPSPDLCARLVDGHLDPSKGGIIASEALNRVKASPLSKREIIRRLGTSAAQFYRLLDPTNHKKSATQLLSLLYLLDCEADLVVRMRKTA
jgi:hypothetical protein